MARYVVTFDTPDAGILQAEAPDLLASYGFSTETYFPRLGIGVVHGERPQLASLSERCHELRRPMTFAETPSAVSGSPDSSAHRRRVPMCWPSRRWGRTCGATGARGEELWERLPDHVAPLGCSAASAR
jgi:hypothetical protein